MSQFSNPANAAGASARKYTESMLALLGERDPLEVMTSTPAVLRDLLRAVDDVQLRRPEAAGKWSMLQVMQHLADTEIVYAMRFRFPVAQERPPITGFDQDAWSRTLWHGDESLEEVLLQYEPLRGANLRFLRRLTDEQWERAGMHAERGAESVRLMAKLAAAHDLVHRAQLERIRG